jgi:hypothetical protein
VRRFFLRGRSVFTLQAFDAAGNASPISGSVAVRHVRRPKAPPRLIPRWAWTFLAWQERASGVRPPTPRQLPRWYRTWKRWRLAPFVIVASSP